MFEPLTRENVTEIVRLQFEKIAEQMAQQGVKMTATDEAVDWLAKLGYDPHFGARPVKRVIQKQLLNELSKQILSGKINKDSEIVLDMFEQQFVFRNLR
jgi:ATP-dependent Clp protease ATP-binding subunit ClpB